jgi:hypothetical protein
MALPARIAAALGVLAIAGATGCGVQLRSPRIDIPAFRAAVTQSTGIRLIREPANPEGRDIPGLSARYTGVAASERLVVLEFFDPTQTREVVGSRPQMRGATVFRRGNVVAFYVRRAGGLNHASAVREALTRARTER